jgi:transcriptional regulator with XRE-family HTH domain
MIMPPSDERHPLNPIHIPLTDVGGALVRLRKDRGLLQKELAQRVGVQPASLNRMERTQYRGVSVERVAQVAEALGIQLMVVGVVPLEGLVEKVTQAADDPTDIPTFGHPATDTRNS